MGQKKPGLLFSALSIEVEDVTTRMKKPCADCGFGFVEGDRRLVWRKGGGRHGKTEVLCEECGTTRLTGLWRDVVSAIGYLKREPGQDRIRGWSSFDVDTVSKKKDE